MSLKILGPAPARARFWKQVPKCSSVQLGAPMLSPRATGSGVGGKAARVGGEHGSWQGARCLLREPDLVL